MAADIINEMKWIGQDKYDDRIVKLLLNEVHPGKNEDVPDPWYGAEPGYHQAYDLIDTACEAIIKNYSK
jgi:protein-tyrosine phosphatase